MTALIGSGRPAAATLVPGGVEPGVEPEGDRAVEPTVAPPVWLVDVEPELLLPELHAAARSAMAATSPHPSRPRFLGADMWILCHGSQSWSSEARAVGLGPDRLP